MARAESEDSLMPSVLDRLIDADSAGTSWRRGYGVSQIVDAVRRDLEDLLNTRQSHTGLPEHFTEVGHSIIAYGLPDLTSLNAITPQQRAEVGRSIELAVAQFEPRLQDIRAILEDSGNEKDRAIRFRIEARLSAEPAPDVAFETILELTTGRYSVQSTDT